MGSRSTNNPSIILAHKTQTVGGLHPGPFGLVRHLVNATKTIVNPRRLAVICAVEVEQKSLLVSEAMNSLPFNMSEGDKNLAHEIVYGTFRYLPGLNIQLGELCKPAKLPPKIRWLLLTSLYQLHFMRTPAYAVIDEANKLAIELKFVGLKALVNGVLRNAERGKEAFEKALSVQKWLLPTWLAEQLKAQYGDEEVASWLESWKERGSLSYWTVDGTGLDGDEASAHLPHAWRRSKPVPIDAFEDRRLYVQNESSQAIAELASRLEPESVLDLCAAPGGKSCYLSAFSKASRIVANDNASDRVARLRRNRDRLGMTFEITTEEALTATSGEFDLVLLDAPCTGIGIIGRHPEIKLLKRHSADEALLQTQAELMMAAWKHVRPGGHLLYTVCSLDQREVPAIPPEAESIMPSTTASLLAPLPFKALGKGFYLTPDNTFDGFSGILLRKQS